MIGSEEEVTKAVDGKGTVADGNFMELTPIFSPNLPISELKDFYLFIYLFIYLKKK